MPDGIIAWVEPPEPEQTRADQVARLLDENPGRWALIVDDGPAVSVFKPWWAPLSGNPRYEVYTDIRNGKRSVYARSREEQQ